MPLDLARPADQVDIHAPEYARLLENLQANIIISHGRDFARLLIVRFTASKGKRRKWLAAFAPKVTTAQAHIDQVKAYRDKQQDGGTVYGLFLSSSGYKSIGEDEGKFKSRAFRAGMKSQGNSVLEHLLGATDKDPKPSTWEGPYRKEVHALINLADDDEARLKTATAALTASLNGIAEVLTIEEGITLRWPTTKPGEVGAPIEHFGYVDGVSNPLYTREDIHRMQRVGHRYNAAPLKQLLVKDPLAPGKDAYGTYFVFRKLRQNVLLFDSQVAALAARLGISPELAGAMAVGRFKDGTPVTESDIKKGLNGLIPNNFDYSGDQDGLKCPFHAHIRKVNPRGDTPLRTQARNDSIRITRRGIPYGLPRPNVDPTVPSDADDTADRGLLFMCCQADIDDQFEFLQQTWADNPHFPKSIVPVLLADTGDDPVIGQDRGEAQKWPRKWGDKNAGKASFNFDAAVTLRGGEYFFCPSLPFLKSLS